MDNIQKLADDILSQLNLMKVMNKKAWVAVYVARQNLRPVIKEVLDKASHIYKIPFATIENFQWFLGVHGHRLDIWEKPAPHPEPANHLLLTVGRFTAVIIDYTEQH